MQCHRPQTAIIDPKDQPAYHSNSHQGSTNSATRHATLRLGRLMLASLFSPSPIRALPTVPHGINLGAT